MNSGETYKFRKKCEVCGKDYLAKRIGKRFCSSYCTKFRLSLKYRDRDIVKHTLLISKGKKPRRGEVRLCGRCHAEIYVLPGAAKKTKTNFCSSKHAWEFWREVKRKTVMVPCASCPALIRSTPSTQKYRPRVTCSKGCAKALVRKRALGRRTQYTQHQLDRIARYSPEAAKWRKAVFARDDYTCRFCKARGGYLEADHILPWAYFPKLRFDLSNGRTLCRPCHNATKIGAKRLREKYAALRPDLTSFDPRPNQDDEDEDS